MQFLNNPAIQLYAAWQQEECLGCMLVTQEGGLDSELISQIQIGKRRPQGHLAPVLLANQLGAVQAATSTLYQSHAYCGVDTSPRSWYWQLDAGQVVTAY